MTSSNAPFLTRQPAKTLCATFTILSVLFKLPLWLIYYIPQRTRQHPQWTYRQAVRNQLVRVVLWYASATQMKTPQNLKPGVEKDRFVLIEPRDSSLYQGILDSPDIKPSTIGAVWYPSLPSASDMEKKSFIIHFHGGAVSLKAPFYFYNYDFPL